MSTLKIYSGGQTGVDRAALDAAISKDIEYGGWCPKGRKAEDGKIPASYKLSETDSPDYLIRTRFNIRDSDATLILYKNKLEGGTKYTYEYAKQIDKPVLLLNINSNFCLEEAITWVNKNNINILNIAGPRESKNPGIYHTAKDIVNELIKLYT